MNEPQPQFQSQFHPPHVRVLTLYPVTSPCWYFCVPNHLSRARVRARARAELQKTMQVYRSGGRTRARKVRHSVTFRRPKTLRQARKAKDPIVARRERVTDSTLLVRPVMSELAMRKLENDNTITFIVALSATKPQLKAYFRRVHQMRCLKVNTLITPNGEKKAYVRLVAEDSVLRLATKFGMI